MSKCVFITGTGTDVGKTYVCGLIIKKMNEALEGKCAYYKAAMSGNPKNENGIIPMDAVTVKNMSSIKQNLEDMYSYVYENPFSPHLAAREEKIPVDMKKVYGDFDALCERYEYVTVEGAGGILCPLRFDDEKFKFTDFIKERNLSCIIVADAGLGTLNYTGLTAYYMEKEGIKAEGIILNKFEAGNKIHEDNLKMCEYMTGLKVLACVKEGDRDIDISFDDLINIYK
jgi:dethiobiotin synthetase